MNPQTLLIFHLTAALLLALLWGYFTHRLGLSTIVGYLIAGILVGPHMPGMNPNPAVAQNMAQNLADIGIILLMFAIGSHFHLKDLLAVRKIALPGAMIQCLVTGTAGALLTHALGFDWRAAIVLGMSVSVASTVVLIRVLVSNKLLQSVQGHVAVGWLIVEDIITVLFLVLLTALQNVGTHGQIHVADLTFALAIAVLKLVALILITFFVGARVIPWLMLQVAKTRSTELFTLTVLVVALSVALISTLYFGASMALGAFLAGMVVGQSDVSHQAAADVLPMRDAFAVLFFVSVGMLFDPGFVFAHPAMLLALLALILLLKPFLALTLVTLLGYSVRTALVVAVGLMQIGEFSFILAKLGLDLGMFQPAGDGLKPTDPQSLLVACAIFSITLNPLLFKLLRPFEQILAARPRLWRLLNARAERLGKETGLAQNLMAPPDIGTQRAVVVGYGPVGRTVTRILRDFGIQPVVIEMNVKTVASLKQAGAAAVFGDASRREILKAAGLQQADFLVITLPDLTSRIPVVAAARALKPDLRILVRAHYLGEREMLREIGATTVIYEEAEAAVALAGHLLHAIGANGDAIAREAERIRQELAPDTPARIEPRAASAEGSHASPTAATEIVPRLSLPALSGQTPASTLAALTARLEDAPLASPLPLTAAPPGDSLPPPAPADRSQRMLGGGAAQDRATPPAADAPPAGESAGDPPITGVATDAPPA